MKQEIGKALLQVFMEAETGTRLELNESYNRYNVPEGPAPEIGRQSEPTLDSSRTE